MFELNIFSLKEFKNLENTFLINNINKNLVILCIGKKNYFYDSFGPVLGTELKKLNLFVYGSVNREVNGLNFKQVYNFIKTKHPKSKVIIIDSVFVKGSKKPILIYKNSPICVSGLNNNCYIGDEGILFNSFSYSNFKVVKKIVNLLKNMFNKCV